MDEHSTYILIGVVRDDEIGLSPTDVMIAMSDTVEPLEEIRDFYTDEEGSMTFESFSGTTYIVSETRIECIH